jgi:hypothetical protein
MKNKKSSAVMITKFLISTLIAVLVFYFLMYKACSFAPFLHDKAPKTIEDVEKILIELSQGANSKRYALFLNDKKAFLFFENNSNEIKMYRSKNIVRVIGDTATTFSEHEAFVFNRPVQYCTEGKPCFCYCDSIIQKTSNDNCNLLLDCKRAKMVCQTFNETFFFQKDLGFFDKDYDPGYIDNHPSVSSPSSLFFQGGFLISPKYNFLDVSIDRSDFVFLKKSNVIHLCARKGDCDTSDRTDLIQEQINQGDCN